MSDTENQTEGFITELLEELRSMPVDIRFFSMSMRALYSDVAVGTNTAPAEKFRELRDKTRNDAIVYLNGLFPLSVTFVASVSEYFEYYEALEYEEWCEILPDILEETICHREMCKTLLQMHEDIIEPLKVREDQARVIVSELRSLRQKFEKMKKELEDKAKTKRSWAIVFAFIPFLNFLVVPFLRNAAEYDLANAVAKGSEAEVQEAAALAVSGMIHALQAFITGLQKAAAFFAVMEKKLRSFEGKAEKAKSREMKAYYTMMKKPAREVQNLCDGFFAVTPQVRTDFRAIPTEGTDQNYVDRWLEKQKKTIQEKFLIRKLASKLLSARTAPGKARAGEECKELDRVSL